MSNGPPTGIGAPASQELQKQQIAQLLQRPDVPRIYANGFAIAQSAADLSVVMLLNGVPTSILSLSFIGAKSLNVELEKALKNVETLLDQKIPTLTEVSAKMAETKGANYVVIGT